MRNIVFEDAPSHPIALLMKPTAFKKQDLIQHYLDPWEKMGVHRKHVLAMTLDMEGKKTSVGFAKAYLEELMPILKEQGCKYLYVGDGSYFKLLTKQSKADVHMGYVLPCQWAGCENMFVVLGVNYQQLIYNPDIQEKLDQSLYALVSHAQGSYVEPGSGIIHKAIYPKTLDEIKATLDALKAYPEVTMDLEAFSLKFWDAGIGTVAIAIDQHNGVAFACDYAANTEAQVGTEYEGFHGRYERNDAVRALIKDFLLTYPGKITWHNAPYDVKLMIYNLFMDNLLDQRGLLDGLEVMTRQMDDTKIIAYLATNSCAGNVLGLKPLAHEFAGNWAKDDIKDIRLIPLDDLLQYNLVDTLSTWFVKNKYYQQMVADQQEDLYKTLFMPSQKLIIQMELTGIPMSRKRIQEVKAELESIRDKYQGILVNSKTIQTMELVHQTRLWEKDYDNRLKKSKTGKIKQKDITDFQDEKFNPGSPLQLQQLLYELMGLPVIDYTDTKQPATGAETIEKLINHTTQPEYIEVLKALIEYSKVTKILSTFIPAFEGAISKDNSDTVWLHGSFNLGGTVSGRLSSSDPNLQNIPAGSRYGKLIKSCFLGPYGWLFCGADFNSLEDYISALTTKDPNKLDVYIKGFDAHCLRAAYYFQEELIAEGLNIDLACAKSVNSLKKMPQYGGDSHPLRQESKPPTFALTYQGTWRTLVANLGWSPEKAKKIEANYHVLYAVSDAYIDKRLEQATKDGYVIVAFGLKVRTPLLKQVVWKASHMPSEAAAEGRTVGNAMGQSYGLLNNRAAVEFWEKVWASPYKYDILPCALIHDAIYPLVKEDPEVLTWANKALIDSMRWQALPEIQHPTVKLGAALDVFWPAWHNAITLPNDADMETVIQTCQTGKYKYLNPEKKKEAA